jgi:adenine deaminase
VRVAESLRTVTDAVRKLGVKMAKPLLSLQALTFTAIPDIRLTFRGLLEVKSNTLVDLRV